MNQKMVEFAMETNRCFKISSKNCEWNAMEKSLEIKGEDWKGVIPKEEMGINLSGKYDITTQILWEIQNNLWVKALRMEDGKYILSRKARTQRLEIGRNYKARIISISFNMIFCDVEGVLVIVYANEYSICKYSNLSNVCKNGDEIEIKVLYTKESDDGVITFYGSRKATEGLQYNIGEEIFIKVSNKKAKPGYWFCEVTPNQLGIVKILGRNVKDGQDILAKVKEISPQGYVLEEMI